MEIAMVAAGFAAGEADKVHRSMAAWQRRGGLAEYRDKLLADSWSAAIRPSSQNRFTTRSRQDRRQSRQVRSVDSNQQFIFDVLNAVLSPRMAMDAVGRSRRPIPIRR
jgi:hypothetical protein